MSKIVWTTLPTGYDGVTLSASIFVAPRLDTTTIIGTPFENWPDTLAGLKFNLLTEPSNTAGGSPTLATPVTAFDRDLYKKVFSDPSVTPFAFQNNAQRPIWSYPVDVMQSFIDSVYAYVAQASPTALPPMDLSQQNTLTNAVTLVAAANSRRIRNRDKMYYPTANRTRGAWIDAANGEKQDIAGLDPTSRAAYLAKRFYTRPASSTSKDIHGYTLPHPAPQVPKFDFHQKLAVLADHPYLLRALGFVIDVTALAPSDFKFTGFVHLKPTWATAPGSMTDVTPRTAYEVQGSRFAPRPLSPTSDAQGGLLALDDTTRFATIQGEPDGDAQKFVDFASNMVRLVSKLDKEALDANLGSKAAPTPQGLPARRTTGFIVTRKGRDAAMTDRFNKNQTLDQQISANAQPDLYLDDLVRGYRVDVRNGTGPWASLHRRKTTYALGVVNPAVIAKDVVDEGYLKAASATSDPDPSGPPDMYLHEALFGWEGWSLAAPRPGRTIMPMYASDDQAVGTPAPTPSTNFQLDARASAVKGSLLPLRFGQKYSFRARVVDLAGNSMAYDDTTIAGTTHATTGQTYKRFEPIPPPTLVLRNVVTEGESVEHLVIRSGEGMDASAYAAYLNANYADPNFAQKTYLGYSDRHVAPPKTSQVTAEAHGQFDGAFLQNADRKAFFRLGTREEGTFSDKRIASLSVDDGYIDGNPNGAMIVTPPQVPMDQRRAADGGPDTSSLTKNRGDALAPGEYVVCSAGNVLVPYLPDVPAGGAVFFDPSTNADVLSTTWQGSWPDVQAYRLRIAHGAAVGVDPSNPTEKVVKLPPATILKLRYASVPSAAYLPHMAYWLDLSQAPDVKTGHHWMLTPSREVTLVHAVQRPLAPPVGFLKLSRQYDATFVLHRGPVNADSRSTGHVDIEASWFEYLDLPSKPLPNDIPNDPNRPALPQKGHAYQVTFQYGSDQVSLDGVKHEFGDTKHRKVTYKPVGTTRYREYFPAALIADTANITLDGVADGEQPDKSFSIPSSARPLVPKVEYVVPTFKWELSADRRTSTRRGGGLRIYFQRPWYTSGEGEQVAVLLTRSVLTGPDTSGYTSRWGRDPIWDSKANAALTAATFKNAKSVVSALQLAETNAVVDAVIFDVEYSPERKLWFCDIEMDPGTTYFPFVSLAVARYQAASLGGIELSPMTRVDFAQLAPDRTCVATIGTTSVSVSVTGAVADNIVAPSLAPIATLPSRVQTTAAPRTHRFVAYIQERAAGSVGDVGWNTTSAVVELAGNVGVASNLGNYSGSVAIPTSPNPGAARRVVVEEHEYFAVDPTGGLILAGPAVSYRLVYIDTIALP